jgi:hypothetical protein
MKIFKELEEQYAYLWWWLLNQGLVVATIIVNVFIASVFAMCMVALVFFIKWFSRH